MPSTIRSILQATAENIVSILKTILSHIAQEPTATIIAGVVVFVICEWVKETWLTPLQEYKRLKAKTSHFLILYAQYYGNPLPSNSKNENYDAGSKEIRLLAAELASFAEIIPLIHFGIPSAKTISKASKNLIGISNSFYFATNSDNNVAFVLDARKDIIKLLKLRGIA